MTPRYKQADRQEIQAQNRQQLLESAAVEFAQESYRGANTNRISKSAGFASGTIFNYFPTKKDLMLALLTETAQLHYDFIVAAVHQTSDPTQRVEVFFEAGFEFIAENLASARVMVNTIYGADEEFRQHLYQVYQPMFQFVATEILAPGIAQNIFRPVDPVATANLLMTIYLGTASQVTDQGHFFLPAAQIADFTLKALSQEGA
jgi:AcrR family transcriptional regulator